MNYKWSKEDHMPPCALCATAYGHTRHHLIPKSRDPKAGKIAKICRPCHSMIHAIFTNQQLEKDYNTIEKLLQHLDIANWVAWRKKHPTLARPKIRRKKGREFVVIHGQIAKCNPQPVYIFEKEK
jgi:hypothetical protein